MRIEEIDENFRAAETVAVADCESLERGLTAFYKTPLSFGEEIKIG